MSPRLELWIGLVELLHRPGAGVLLDRNGAYTNVVGPATSAEEFAKGVSTAAAELGFDVVAIEDVEPLAHRQAHFVVETALLEMAEQARLAGAPRFGSFFTWRSEG